MLSIVEGTTVDGPGFRTTIYCAGCRHACPGCHNPQSWNEDGGEEMTIEEIMQKIEADPFSNVTFSGGDPMFQPEGFLLLAREIKRRTNKTIWCYTGFTFDALLIDPKRKTLLKELDVVVDGPFVKSLRDTSLIFRGSSNQRIIDVQKTFSKGLTLWKP